MALSIPVVVTNVGGMPEILNNSNAGFIINKNNNQELTEKINILLEDNNLHKTMSLNARMHYENNFMVNRMTRKYYNLLKI